MVGVSYSGVKTASEQGGGQLIQLGRSAPESRAVAWSRSAGEDALALALAAPPRINA
jgi:hypothetical protein